MAPFLSTRFGCNDDGVCSVCKQTPSLNDVVLCGVCAARFHVDCIPASAVNMTSLEAGIPWNCPDCSPPVSDLAIPAKKNVVVVSDDQGFDLNCCACMKIPERPVTAPCGHNMCLKCFEKWVGEEGKGNCMKCGAEIPSKMAKQPRINCQLVLAIRMSRMPPSSSPESGGEGVSIYEHYKEILKREAKGKSGKGVSYVGGVRKCVNVEDDHFGPIWAENDPMNNEGVLVGEKWENRMGCRQWGVHNPIVASVDGKSDYGAQSVVLTGDRHEDDEDHGDWFLLTGSDSIKRNLCMGIENRLDQEFDKLNEALRLSCVEGYPVRVVRCHKQKRSPYAPEAGLRYDGIYRVEKCWRKHGLQGYKVCRYLFVRSDNEPAPWTSEENGDRPRPLPEIGELTNAMDLTERNKDAAWGYNETWGRWVWKRSPPHVVRRLMNTMKADEDSKLAKFAKRIKYMFAKEKLSREYRCKICEGVLSLALTTPCFHNFCKECLFEAFYEYDITNCPSCSKDIIDFFLQNPQVNKEVMGQIESLKLEMEENREEGMEEEEEQARKRRRIEGPPIICLLNRQQSFDEFIQQQQDDHDDHTTTTDEEHDDK